jgi:hypothetical protein
MSDPFAESRFPGERVPYDVSPWQDFEPDPQWSDSVLRVRSIYGGKSVQFAGTLRARLPADTEASIGVLGSEFRPPRTQNFIVPIAYAQWADLQIEPDGRVRLRSREAMTETTFRRVYSLAGL